MKLSFDTEGDKFDEHWKYPTGIGILLYLSGNSRPDIVFAVNQCTRFTCNTQQFYAVAVKRIVRYLQGTKDIGMKRELQANCKLDFYVDVNYSRLWGQAYD